MKNLLVSLGLLAAASTVCGTASATSYFFSDCQAGAAGGCVVGNDSNPGTSPASPWRSTAKLQSAFNAGKPGDQFLLARGGAWSNVAMTLFNTNGGNPSAMIANPMVIDSYAPSWGGVAKPILSTGSDTSIFDFTNGSTPDANGGYTLRNLSLKSGGVGVRLFNGVQNVTLDNLTIDGFTAGVACGGVVDPASNPSFITVRNSTFLNNSAIAIGMFGCPNVLVEGNTLDNNGFTRPGLDHPIYISGNNYGYVTNNVVIRNNRLTNNAVSTGYCRASVIVGHDVGADWVVENNTIYQAPGTSYPTCWGISFSPANGGYLEGMDRLIIRGNTIVNVGNNGIEVAACRTCTIENNVLVWETDTEAIAIRHHLAPTTPTYVGTALTVRNNSVFFFHTSDTSRGVVVNDQGTNHTVVSNLVYFGAGSVAHACFDTNLSAGAFSAWNNNLCFGAPWTGRYATRSAFNTATGFDANAISANPQLAATPTLANSFSMALASGSPAINAGSRTLSATLDRLSSSRSLPDIGAFEWSSGGSDTVSPAAPPVLLAE